jgi:two-component system OmpR family sensor kinase
MRSIAAYLLRWVLGALLISVGVVALATYVFTLDEINEVYDAELKNLAVTLGAHDYAGSRADRAVAPQIVVRSDPADPAEIVTVTRSRDGTLLFSSDPRVALPLLDQEGVSRTRIGGEEWIVYTHMARSGVAQAAQRSSAREESAAESAAKILLPMTGVALAVAALMVLALRRGLKPLDVTSRDIARRSAGSLSPVPVADVPREIMPLVCAINDLMDRLSVAFAAQRRFIADAAHELRTPVTALRLQLQLLQRASDEGARRAAVTELEAGIARSQRLIEQLLQVERYESDSDSRSQEVVDLAVLAREVVGAMSARADHLGIDLGAGTEGPVRVHADPDQLRVLLTNLVENALRYTPSGGVVDVVATQQDARAVLLVIDDGPGIPEAERDRVFERFYRTRTAPQLARDTAGSGLGLAIVKSIAERHGATVSLHDGRHGRGLEARVVFGRPPA